jgi:hypothetical protein
VIELENEAVRSRAEDLTLDEAEFKKKAAWGGFFLAAGYGYFYLRALLLMVSTSSTATWVAASC